jgi:hypothetical protein
MALGALPVILGPRVVGTLLGGLAMGLIGTVSLMANQAIHSDMHGSLRTTTLAESHVAAMAAITLRLPLSRAAWPGCAARKEPRPCRLRPDGGSAR